MRLESWFFAIASCIFAPLLPGVINRVKAYFAGRSGVPIFQLYYDIFKLLRKGTVYSLTTTGITRIAPSIVLGSIIIAVFIIPWGTVPAPFSFTGDIILLTYLLGLSRFVTVLAALDTGSSFEGMGASREVHFGMLVEPSIFLGMLVLVLHSGQLGISPMFANIDRGMGVFGFAPLLLVAFSWSVALLTENSRMPVDDPNTHLELTMIHEVMILDSSGPDLGYMLYASALKLWLFCALIANLLVSNLFSNMWIKAPVFLAAVIFIAFLVGIVESVMARLRFRQIPKLLIGSGALGAIALILMVLGNSK